MSTCSFHQQINVSVVVNILFLKSINFSKLFSENSFKINFLLKTEFITLASYKTPFNNFQVVLKLFV